MRTLTLNVAAAAALALAACQTTAESDGDGTSATAAPSTSGQAAGGSWSDPDDTLHDRVHDALMEKMGPAVNAVGVKTEGSKVILTGHVKTEAEKQQAHDIAHGVAGVSAVDISQLAVQP